MFLTKGLCVNTFNYFNLAAYRYELSGRGDDILLSILIQDCGVPCENQLVVVVGQACNTIGGLGVSSLLYHRGDKAKISEV